MPRKNVPSNISLIGFSATGKSVVGKAVAKKLGWSFVDIDDEIVRICGKSIPEIFDQEGEGKFRQIESDVLRKTCQKENVVIATGGGAIVNSQNRDMLHTNSFIVCLDAQDDTIHNRLLQDKSYSSTAIRPLLVGDKPLERIKKLKASRRPLYAVADLTVHTDDLNVEEVTSEVIKGWQHTNNRYKDERKSTMTELAFEVEATTERYPVYIGWDILGKVGEKMRQAGLSGTAAVISDETVFSIYGDRVKTILERNGCKVNCYVLPPGEATKTINHMVKIYDFLVENHVERGDSIVALGGGVVGDIAGFAAATFLRGLPWIQIPTTLVGMADASIGGKVAIDHKRGKNLIGSFYQPRLVLTNVQSLTTLPKREVVSGWSETIKHGVILDADFFGLLEDKVGELLSLAPMVTTAVIVHSAGIKAQVVAEDEKETGKRIILNYGHTIAHGLEAATGYKRFLHGEAVAIGMSGAAKLSQRLGISTDRVAKRLETLLQKFGLPTNCSKVDLRKVLAAMELDKKVKGKAIRWILPEDIGRVVVRDDIPQQQVMEVLREVIKP